MNIQINNHITIEIRYQGRKVKSNETNYCIYLVLTAYQKGVTQLSHCISTGVVIAVKEWARGKVIGRTEKAKVLNEKLFDYLIITKNLLQELSYKYKNVKSCGEIFEGIKNNLRERITGKVRRREKQNCISKLKSYTYHNIYGKISNKRLADKIT